MMGVGFLIRTIRSIGPNLKNAEVTFQDGLNVVTGASETGKSYVLQCIDYMLGGKVPPKDVPEGKSYETLLLEYEDRSGSRFVLERSLRLGGAFRHYKTSLGSWVQNVDATELLDEQDAERADTISHLLLNMSGLAGTKLLTRAAGETNFVSFRDVCRFSIVREGDVIAERSPVLAGDRYFKDSKCISMFGIFLTGRDYSSVIAPPDIKASKAKWQASTFLLTELINEGSRKASEAQRDPIGLRAIIREYDERIEKAASTIEKTIGEINSSVALRKQHWTSLTKMRSRLLIVEQMLQRFDLLDQHYKSDLDRLRFVAEGEYYLSQLSSVHCPVCGKLMDDHTREDIKADKAKNSNIQKAAKAEAQKILIHIKDLSSTTKALRDEEAQLRQEITLVEGQISAAENNIKRNLEPQIADLKQTIEDISKAKETLTLSEYNRVNVESLTLRWEAFGKEPRAKRVKMVDAAGIDTGELRAFCDRVEAILREWKLPGIGTVEFGKKWEIVVGGKSTFGKGYIAIIRSAFTIALMQHASEKAKHPGFVVIDSPLTSFKQADAYQAGADVKIAFYTHLLKLPENQQVIIIENERPPTEVETHLSHEHFSGNLNHGRSGFYPRNGIHQ